MTTINEKIDYLFSRINWKDSLMDATAIHIMNNLKSDIQKEKDNIYNSLSDEPYDYEAQY